MQEQPIVTPAVTRTRRKKTQQPQPQAPTLAAHQPPAPVEIDVEEFLKPEPGTVQNRLDDDEHREESIAPPAPVQSAPAMEFFDTVRSIPEAKWNVEKWEIYLYRVEPKVKNTDRPKYICVYHTPTTLEDIKSEHGGGVYKAWLKKNGQQVQTDVFAIDGPPLLQPDQVLVAGSRSAAPAPNPAPPSLMQRDSDAGEIITRVADVLERKKDPLQDALLQAAIKRLTSEDKDPLSTKLMELAFANLQGGKKDSVADSFVLALAKRGLDPTPAAAATADPLGLRALKEILGPDVSLKDILLKGIGGGGGEGSDWKAGAITVAGQLANQLPSLVQQAGGTIIESKRLDVQLATIQLERERLAIAARGIAVPPPIQLPAAPPAQPAPGATAPATAGDPLDVIAALIVRCAEQGDQGDSVVAVVQRAYPEAFAQLAPFLNDVDQVMAFLPSHPVLQRLTALPNHQLFVQQFVEGVNEYLTPDDDPAGEGEETGRAGRTE